MELMKKFIVLAILPFLLISCEKEKVMSLTETPSEINTYITTHFPNKNIIQGIKDTDGLELTYDITLESGIYLEFNRKKEVIKIHGIEKLPDSVIPEKLLAFVSLNYANNYIVKWELDDRNQKITLNNSTELEFNMNGDFLRIDN